MNAKIKQKMWKGMIFILLLVFTAPGELATAQTQLQPTFRVDPLDDRVSSLSPWSSFAKISLKIEDDNGVLYTASQPADITGNFQFYLGDVFGIEPGHKVTVSDGPNTKTHIVTSLSVNRVEVSAEVLDGRADAGTTVEVGVNGDGILTVTAGVTEYWIVDFSGTTDLTYLSSGYSRNYDSDGDSTEVRWPYPKLQVSPNEDWVGSNTQWTPGANISLTIEDGSGVVYSDSGFVASNGTIWFALWGGQFDIKQGHKVTVSDGETTKTHTVTNLFLDSIDLSTDTLYGRAEAGTTVDVCANWDCLNIIAVEGNWTADFSGMTDLTDLTEGSLIQTDSEGDSTHVAWASPRFQVDPDRDWVGSYRQWPSGANIYLTIEDGSGVLYADSQSVDVDGYFQFDLRDVFDIKRGQKVTVYDGESITKTHTVTNLLVDSIDFSADTLYGQGDEGIAVKVELREEGPPKVIAEGSKNWIADFSGISDLAPFSYFGLSQTDSDGDSTEVEWDYPRFLVDPDRDWVTSDWGTWTPRANISLKIEENNVEVYSASQFADFNGNFQFNLGGMFDITRGHHVTVSDGKFTKTHTVTNLFVDRVDYPAYTLYGRAEAGTDVYVRLFDEDQTVKADGIETWIADFSGMTDLPSLSDGRANQTDIDGDSTEVGWPYLWIVSVLEENRVVGRNWPLDEPVTISIDDPATPEIPVDYTDTRLPDPRVPSGTRIEWNLDQVLTLTPGMTVTLTSERFIKQHVVQYIEITGVDIYADKVYGRAAPQSELGINAYLVDDTYAYRRVESDGEGYWNADFSQPGPGHEEEDILNLGAGTSFVADLYDIDDDRTRLNCVLAAPSIVLLEAPLTPVKIGTQITAQATLQDSELDDTYQVVWEWGNGETTIQTVTGFELSADHTYTLPGVYEITLSVTEEGLDPVRAAFQFVVVYDPEGGFVTGGGWFDSLPGWCQLNELCTEASGKANFGFISKYKMGASIPDGNTEFQFKAGNLNFHSSSYDWLVVTGSNYARFKGAGLINSTPSPNGEGYKFMIWAGDETGVNGSDTFRIKIWYEQDSAEIIVYDNGMDQTIGGGSIQVHKVQ